MARRGVGARKRPKVQCSESTSDLGLYVGADDGNRTRTVSLGTGLSCLDDLAMQDQLSQTSTREWPSNTVFDRLIGHATGTPPRADPPLIRRSMQAVRQRPSCYVCWADLPGAVDTWP